MVSRSSVHDPQQYGFTMVELIVVIAVMAILATIAAPSVSQALANRRMKNAAFELQSSILQARSFAASFGRPVGMFPAYSNGWTVLNANRDTSIVLPNSNDVSKANLVGAKLSWYVVTPGAAGSATSTTGVGLKDSTTNAYPIQVSLPDQTLITVSSIPVSAATGICFYPAGYVGNTISGSASCSTPPPNNLTQVTFRVCDSGSSLKGTSAGYTVLVGPFGTVRTFMGDPGGTSSC